MIFEKLDISDSRHLVKNHSKSPNKVILPQLQQKNSSKKLVRRIDSKAKSKPILTKRTSPIIINLNLPAIPSLPTDFHRNEDVTFTPIIRQSYENLMSEYFKKRKIVYSKIKSHLK
jgi:hypothetical protein